MSYPDEESSSTYKPVDIRRAAMNIMAAREHSAYELQQKLLTKGMPQELVSQELVQLQQENLLNDERFAEVFVRSRFHKGQGPLKIRYELNGRGVDNAFIEQALADYDEQWLDLAGELRVKKFGHEIPQEFKEKGRQARFLTQRGFSQEQVRRVLQD